METTMTMITGIPEDMVARALHNQYDEIWDAPVRWTAGRLQGRILTRMKQNSHFYLTILRQELEENNATQQYQATGVTSVADMAATELPNATTQPSNSHFLNISDKLISTKVLIGMEIGSWSDEEWFKAEDLFFSTWAANLTPRCVVLQFALSLRVLQELKHIRSSKNNQTKSSFTTAEPKGNWLNLQTLNRMVSNWQFVYVGGQSVTLRDAHLKPADVLDLVTQVYHGTYDMNISAQTLRIILEARVATLPKYQRPELVDSVLDQATILLSETWKPKAALFNLAAFGWVKSALGQETIEQVQLVLRRMTELSIQFDKYTYAHALQARAQRGTRQAAMEAESILRDMVNEYYKRGNRNVQPDANIFALVITAWENSGDPEAGPRATKVYQTMVEFRDSERKRLADQPSSPEDDYQERIDNEHLIINNVVQCWYTAPNDEQGDAAMKAEAFLRSIPGLSLTNVAYGTVMSLYARAGDIVSVERLLEEMEAAAAKRAPFETAAGNTEPGPYTYTAVLSAYAKAPNELLRDKIRRAEDILQRMQKFSSRKPNTVVYNGKFCFVLVCFVLSVSNCFPCSNFPLLDVVMFIELIVAAYLDVIANSTQSSRGRKAENILMDMKMRGAENKDVLPDYISYSVC
jgi:pentatricopeptide repeat protein